MKTIFLTLQLSLFLSVSSCIESKTHDYRNTWNNQGKELKILLKSIKSKRTYICGNHDFPDNFSFPFDNGFYVSYGYDENRKAIRIDNKNLTVKFYTDRGLMDHYSAFIYSNDKNEIEQLNNQVESDKKDTDVKLEKNWYYIQE